MSRKVTFYLNSKKLESYPEDAIKLTKTSLAKNVTKEMHMVFTPIKVTKTRFKAKLVNKLAKAIKIMFDYDNENLSEPVTLKNIKDGVFDERIVLKIGSELPDKVSSVKIHLDDSNIFLELE